MQRMPGILGLGLLITVAMWISGCGTSDVMDQVGQRYTAQIAIQDLDEETLTVDVIRSYCDSGDLEDYGPAKAAVTISVDADAPGITLKGYTLEYFPLESEDGTGQKVMPPTLDSEFEGGNLGIDIASGETATFNITCFDTDQKEEYRLKAGWVLYTEDPDGLVLLQAKGNEVDAKIAEVQAKEDEIVAAEQLGLDTAGLELQLDRLNEELDELELEYNQMLYGFYTIPELQEARYKFRITFHFEDQYGNDRTISRDRTIWLGPYNNC